MLQPLEQLVQQVSRTDQQLMYHLILEQRETNRLLNLIAGQAKEESDENDMKRPELMKLMAKLPNKPPGWNKWPNEQMIEHLKGVG